MTGSSTDARDGLGSVTRGSLILLLGTIGFVGANFVARVILVRNLSPSDFGEFYIALTLAGLLSAIGQLGLPSAIARSIPYASSDDDRRAIIRAAFSFGIPLAVGAGVVLLLLSIPISIRYNEPILGLTLQYFAIALTAAILTSQIAAIFQGFEDVRPNAIFVQVLNPVLFIAFLLLFLTEGPGRFPLGYRGALIAYVGGYAAALVGILVYYRVQIRKRIAPGPRNPAATHRLLLFALPLFVVGVLSILAGSVDTLVLGFFHNSEAGDYGAALSLARLGLIGLGALAYILLPVVARYVRYQDTPSAGVIYGTATRWMVLTALPFAIIFFVFPANTLAAVYNANYTGAALPLQILILGALASAMIGPAAATQVSFGQTRLLLYNNLAGALTDGILSLVLIPPYGLVGAAIAWASASALMPALAITELVLFQGVRPFRWSYPAALVATAVPIGLLYSRLPISPGLAELAGLFLLAAAVYVFVSLLIGGVTDGDRMLLEAVEGMIRRPVPGARWLGRRFRRGPSRPRG